MTTAVPKASGKPTEYREYESKYIKVRVVSFDYGQIWGLQTAGNAFKFSILPSPLYFVSFQIFYDPIRWTFLAPWECMLTPCTSLPMGLACRGISRQETSASRQPHMLKRTRGLLSCFTLLPHCWFLIMFFSLLWLFYVIPHLGWLCAGCWFTLHCPNSAWICSTEVCLFVTGTPHWF